MKRSGPYQRLPKRQAAPCGFTLLEVLLALGLSVVLLVAVASSIELYRRMTSMGQSEVKEARLVRAIFRKIERDIRAVVPPQPLPTTATTSGGSTSSTTTTSTSSTTSSITAPSSSSANNPTSSSTSTTSTSTTSSASSTDPLQTVYSQNVFGLYGDAGNLILNTLDPQRLMAAPQQGQGPVVQPALAAIHSDLKIVAYFLTSAGSTGSMLTTLAPTSSTTTSPTSVPGAPAGAISPGLARLEGDRVAVSYAMQQSNVLASAARVISPEVTALQFRYFDGSMWQISWDGYNQQALPQAVEITLALRVEGTPAGVAASSTTTTSIPIIHTYRHVVYLSTSAPPAATDGTGSTQ